MQDNDPTQQTQAPVPAPPPMQPPVQPVVMPVPTQTLPDADAGPRQLERILFSVLVIAASGVAIWQFGPWHQAAKPAPAPVVDTTDAKATLGQVDSAFDSIDANMAGVDPALSDQQGNLGE